MHKTPKISVVIPVYNVKVFLKDCLDSLINQTLKDIEIICVDDESTDGSYDLLLQYAEKDNRIIVLRQKNGGAGTARNNGMQYVTGEYLAVLDADDFYELEMLEKAYLKIKENNSDIVVYGCDYYNNATEKYSPNDYSINKNLLPQKRPFSGTEVSKDIFKLFVGWSWDKLFKTSFVKENNLYFQEQRTTNDMLFVFSAIVKADRIDILDDVLAHHRREAGSLSVTREKSWHCFYDALVALKTQLTAWNLYNRFEQDYLNYCIHFSLWNLNTLKEPTRTLLYNKLKDEWFEKMGVKNHPESYFYNKYEYLQYKLILKYNIDEKHSFVDAVGLTARRLSDIAIRAVLMVRNKGIVYLVKKAIIKLTHKDIE